jgi:methylthioribose-1-phosphate isomerase
MRPDGSIIHISNAPSNRGTRFMKTMISLALRYEDGALTILDQTGLPQQENWLVCETVAEMVTTIQQLKVRGAPLIGIAAVLLLAKMVEAKAPTATLQESAKLLKKARPTAVNLMICIDRFLAALAKSRADAIAMAEYIFDEDIALCEKMANYGAALIQSHDNILTYCNTGGLATAGEGTALGAIKKAHAQGKTIHVYASETRPLLQGGRLTIWELSKSHIPATLCCDNMVASLMRMGKIDKIFVGSDRIAANGDFANKIGTYNIAVLAKHHHIPFYVVAPYTTVDNSCPNGNAIAIEQRNPDEVRGVAGSFGKVIWSLPEVHTYNPAFDVTPAEYVTGYILDSGIFQTMQDCFSYQ